MDENLLIFACSKTNKNSLAALGGALETFPVPNLEIKVIPQEKILNFPAKILSCYSKIFLAFSFQTPDILSLFSFVPRIKKRFKKYNLSLFLLAGGSHPTGAPLKTLGMGFDFIFVGEGEESLRNFLEETIAGKKEITAGKIITTDKAQPLNITKYPPIAPRLNLFGPIEITRGCPYTCKFCQTSYLFGKQRHRKIKQIIWSVEQMVKKGLGDVRFITPNLLSYGSRDGFTPNLPILEKMLSAVRKVRGVKRIFAGTFPSEIRPEQINEKALLLIKKYSNNDNIIIGAQSGSERMLKACQRRHTTNDIYNAVNLAIKVGFKINADFIFGMPGETQFDLEQTIKMIKKLIQNPKVRIHSHTFLPLAGTPWENEKPGIIRPTLRKFLISLRKRGKEYGDWEKQERIGKLLVLYKTDKQKAKSYTNEAIS